MFVRVAQRIVQWVGHPVFFAACLGGVLIWLVLGPVAGYSNRWQLSIQTSTAIVTFLLVALLQNSAQRSDHALHKKLDVIADALADYLANEGKSLAEDVEQLKEAVGLEQRDGGEHL